MSICKAGPCASFGRIRRRRRGANCRRSRIVRPALCLSPRSCQVSSQATKPANNGANWSFLPHQAHRCATATGRRDVFDPAVEALGLRITPHICVTPRHRWRSRKVRRSSRSPACWVTNQRRPRSTIMRVLFPTDLDDIASRLDAAARLTIASHGASSDAKPSPTKAPTRTSQH